MICHPAWSPRPAAAPSRTGGCASTTNQAVEALMSGTTEIRTFRVDMPDEALDDLRRRIGATRLPGK